MEATKDVRSFVVENFLYGDDDRLEDDTSFLSSGIIDSTGMLELIHFIEDTYDLRIADEEMIPENLDSIERVNAFIERKRADS